MKLLLTIGCILLFFCSLTPRYFFSPGEYAEILIDRSDSVAYFVSGVVSIVSGTPAKVIGGAAGSHGSYLIDTAHNLYYQGDNTAGEAGLGDTASHSGYNRITVDSSGNPFTNVAEVCAGGTAYGNNWNAVIRKYDGTVWEVGNTQGGFRGDGSDGYRANTRPVQVTLPGGITATKIQGGDHVCIIGSDGNEYKWGGNYGFLAAYELAQGTSTPTYKVPTKATFGSETAAVIDIAEGPQCNFTLLANRHMYGASYYGGLLMVGVSTNWNTPGASYSETRIDTAYANNITDSIVDIQCNSAGIGIRTVTGKLYYSGDNICGSAGNGTGINWATYTGSNGLAPWNWDQNLGEFFIRKPVQVAPGHFFTDFFMANTLNYSMLATDSANRMIAMGRGKSGVLADSTIELNGSGITAARPNSYDRIYATYVNPFGTGGINVYARYCVLNQSGSPCNSISYGSHSPSTVNLSARYVSGIGLIISTAGSTGSNPGFSATVWQTSGPAVLDMNVQSSQGNVIVDTVKTAAGATISNGTYTFTGQIINNYYDTALASVSVQVGSYFTLTPGQKVAAH